MLGLVRASNSECASDIGVIKKYKVEADKPAKTANPKLVKDFRNKAKSYVAKLYPIPSMGPINGEINIAPIMTAVELTLRPTQAIRMAKINIQRFVPLK